ncbi:EF-P beta-lysylation protein EpmB [Coxiella endosymbiont of Amblyomma americanum]|uniref:EF-P beta-lysylation protein EpmB n=1 Tax=Coxiella endosymbiont of Amblyomma americanum TaxID=325775 RepID=UPI00057FA310|nr:EF-P beta-lysylation protein EpmB [Coxiella endosymbiont of Amblyomma americanum]AJC50176.1 lysine 2,3-aminomutase [Coxiella endosymbiont of Amblyomma americanum]AUJ58535.1 EF-P beta-lysylation protein EpmB [Coxiella-like endosymbiont of Amblyomma americanum]
MHSWQYLLKGAITDVGELYREVTLNANNLKLLSQQTQKKITDQFPLLVPKAFVTRMEKGNPKDPLLLQVLPQKKELVNFPDYQIDPLNEKQSNIMPGLLHKYYGRVLLTLSGACAIHCRYCFRRYFPYKENTPGKRGWSQVFNYLRSNTSVTEVILSGGDPLMIKDDTLIEFISSLEKITHLRRLRIHTRLPIVIPERITDTFLNLLNCTRLLPIIVVHCNHPNEIDKSVIKSLSSLQKTRATLLNQSVLLKDINNKSEVLIRLSEDLFEIGVLPYYLHSLDRVHGAAHFEVSEIEARCLIKKMMKRLPGYLVPKLVRESTSAPAKVPISIL